MNSVGRIVVVGAGECGAAAATALRQNGFNGSITLVGAEARLPYERPPLSKSALVASEQPTPTTVADEARFTELGVDFIRGTAVEVIDPAASAVGLADGRELPYDRLLLATGARARALPIAGGGHALTLRTFEDSLALRSRLIAGSQLVVLGAGFIGLEVAASARERGCEVTVLELAPTALSRAVPAAIAAEFVNRHRKEGVDVRFNCRVTAIRETEAGFAVDTADSEQPLTADVVVAGIGAVPNVELATEAGLECDNGVVTNSLLQTSDPSIYAAGDCAAASYELFGGRRIRLESWRNAYDQAATAAANMLGGSEVHHAVPWFWSDQYDLGLQLAGLFDMAADIVTRRRPDGTNVLFGLDESGRLVAAAAVGAGTSIAKDIRVAEMMVAARRRPSTTDLSDPDLNLKTLLRQESA